MGLVAGGLSASSSLHRPPVAVPGRLKHASEFLENRRMRGVRAALLGAVVQVQAPNPLERKWPFAGYTKSPHLRDSQFLKGNGGDLPPVS